MNTCRMTNRGRSRSQVELLLKVVDQACDHRSWHGTNLRGALRGLTAAQAAWRPQPQRYCIAEHVLHAAYWKYAVGRRLRGEKRGSFPLKGSDWFPLPKPWSKNTWRECVRILAAQHRAFRAAVAGLSDSDLPRAPEGGKVTTVTLITGVAAHDLYHTGQIQLLKRLQKPARNPSKRTAR